MKTNLILLAIFLMLTSCTKDRLIGEDTPISVIDSESVSLKINEFVAKGSVNVNEFGDTEDWLEIYNPTLSNITFHPNTWYITDDLTSDSTKFELPPHTIASKGFLVIWCDENSMSGNDIHAPFKLSSSGEDIALVFRDSLNQLHVVDAITFGTQSVDGQSTGRYPDGTETWNDFANPTPGQSNN